MDRSRFTFFSLSLITLFAALGALAGPAPAAAQDCDTDWSQPYVCEIELVASVRGQNARSPVRDTLRLAPGTSTVLSVRPIDQAGRGFPAERFAYQIVPGSSCSGLVDIGEQSHGEIRIDSGNRGGSCELTLRPANNLNLDRRVTLQVAGTTLGEVRDEVRDFDDRSEILASWLYRGILGREGEVSGISAAAASIAAGHLDDQVETMLVSQEFAERRRGMSAAQLLDSFYQGLLGRAPDPAGARRYTDDLIRGDFDDVIEEILESDELRDRLNRAVAQ